MVDAFPDNTAPRWPHRDRDRIYGDTFQRLIGSIRRECLSHVIIINESHLRPVLTTYILHYHRTRTHLGLQKDTPIIDRWPKYRPGQLSRSRKSVVSITDMSGAPRNRPSPFARQLAALGGPYNRDRT